MIRLDIMDGVDGGCAVGGAPGFVGIPPDLVRQAQVPFPGSAFHRRCCLPAYQMWVLKPPPECPPPASRMGVEALPGAFPGKGDRDCRKPGEIADLTLSSGRGPGRVSSQMRTIKLALTPL